MFVNWKVLDMQLQHIWPQLLHWAVADVEGVRSCLTQQVHCATQRPTLAAGAQAFNVRGDSQRTVGVGTVAPHAKGAVVWGTGGVGGEGGEQWGGEGAVGVVGFREGASGGVVVFMQLARVLKGVGRAL